MANRQRWRQYWLITFVCGIINTVFAETNNNFCSGPKELLSVVNRPTVADSPCTAPDNKVLVELGYQYLKLRPIGLEQNYPEAELRFGLPKDNEIYVFLPNYVHHSFFPYSGFNTTSIGYKHEIDYTHKWIVTLDSSVTPSSGSRYFGDKGWGALFGGLYSYNFNDSLNITCELTLTTQTASSFDGGQRFTSLNPDAFLTWSINDNLQAYGEIYGQTKTAVNEGSGFNIDGGLIYLVSKNFTIDLEAGQRLNGSLEKLEHYFGTGMVVQF